LPHQNGAGLDTHTPVGEDSGERSHEPDQLGGSRTVRAGRRLQRAMLALVKAELGPSREVGGIDRSQFERLVVERKL